MKKHPSKQQPTIKFNINMADDEPFSTTMAINENQTFSNNGNRWSQNSLSKHRIFIWNKNYLFNLTVLYLISGLISPIASKNINMIERMSYVIQIQDQAGNISFSECLGKAKRQPSGPSAHPSFPKSIKNYHRTNVNCQWIFKPLISSEFAIDFNIHILDLPDCPESFIRFVSRSAIDGSRILTILNNTSVSKAAFSVKSSHLSVTYQRSAHCRANNQQGFYISFKMHPLQRLRRDVSGLGEENLSPGARISQQPMISSSTPTALLLQNIQATQKRTANPSTTNKYEEESKSSDTWKIVVGVIIPVLIILIVLFAAYKIYRKKFPVRMILGREFSKFRNPDYRRPRTNLTLVREDTDWGQTNRMSTEYNPNYHTSNYKIPVDNPGFEDDDIVDCDTDESKKDREYRMKKSWLFRKEEEQGEKQKESSEGPSGENSDSHNVINEDETDAPKKKVIPASKDTEFSDDSDIEAMLQEQGVTPRLKRKELSQSDLSSSSSSCEQLHDVNTTEKDHSHSSLVGNSNGATDSSNETEKGNNFLGKIESLFQQPSFEEMRAELKARARSMSGSKCVKPVRQRSCSLQIDPSKSARRGSNAQNDSSGAANELLRFVHSRNQITASVVGVTYLSESVRAMYSSLPYVNSNPHLVTDLDEDISDDVFSVVTNDKRNVSVNSDPGQGVKVNQIETIHSDSSKNEIHDSNDDDSVIMEVEQNHSPPTNRVVFQMGPSNIEHSLGSKSGEELGSQKELEIVSKTKVVVVVEDDDDVDDVDDDDDTKAVNTQSTSGSSSSSDTHSEEHPVHMSKPGYNPQISTMSISSDPTNVKSEDDDTNKNFVIEDKSPETVQQDGDDNKARIDGKAVNRVPDSEKVTTLSDIVLQHCDQEGNAESSGFKDCPSDCIQTGVESVDAENTSLLEGGNPAMKDETCRDSDSNNESCPGPGAETKESYIFQFSQQQQQQLSPVGEASAENNPVHYTQGTNSNHEYQINQESPQAVMNTRAVKELGSSSVSESSRLRIISEIELSDASSDSSDILQDEQNHLQNDLHTKPHMKKITFDLNKIVNDDDEDDDDNEDDDDDDDGDYDDTDDAHIENDDVNNNINSSDAVGETNSLTVDISKLELTTQRGRRSTDRSEVVGDVYNEFSDETIDNMLLREDDNDNNLDSNCNLPELRTIGLDPDVMFSFQSKRQFVDRDDGDDDIDV